MHYGIGVLPARPRKPRDKAKVEVGVQIAQRWIVAALRHRKFFSLRELNLAIRELLEKLNQRPFQKREGSRRSLFVEVDQPALRPLPAERFDLSVWSQATVNIDYHIQFERSFYRATLCCSLNNLSDSRWPPKSLRRRERHANRGLKSWVQKQV